MKKVTGFLVNVKKEDISSVHLTGVIRRFYRDEKLFFVVDKNRWGAFVTDVYNKLGLLVHFNCR